MTRGHAPFRVETRALSRLVSPFNVAHSLVTAADTASGLGETAASRTTSEIGASDKPVSTRCQHLQARATLRRHRTEGPAMLKGQTQHRKDTSRSKRTLQALATSGHRGRSRPRGPGRGRAHAASARLGMARLGMTRSSTRPTLTTVSVRSSGEGHIWIGLMSCRRPIGDRLSGERSGSGRIGVSGGMSRIRRNKGLRR